jgi:RimJ/RimL family protein N-acetyltransferase
MEPPRLLAGPVTLRPLRASDVEGVLDHCRDPATSTLFPTIATRADAERFLLDQAPRGWRDGDLLTLAIADTGSDAYLGIVALSVKPGGAAEVTYGVRPSARGRGAMTRALRALVDWAFSAAGPDLSVLHWRAPVGSWAARRVAWRVGFRVEGVLRGGVLGDQGRHDCWIGSLLASDPRQPANPWYTAPILRGRRCVLRPFRESDAEAVVEGCTDPLTRHWLSHLPDPYTTAEALSFIRSREEVHASGRGVHWAAADPDTDECVGAFGLNDVDERTGTAEIGYWVHPRARGKGVATEATRLIVRHATLPADDGGLGLRRLTLQAAAQNVASQRVAERAGLRLAGVWRAAQRLGDGTVTDMVAFDLLADDVTAPVWREDDDPTSKTTT